MKIAANASIDLPFDLHDCVITCMKLKNGTLWLDMPDGLSYPDHGRDGVPAAMSLEILDPEAPGEAYVLGKNGAFSKFKGRKMTLEKFAKKNRSQVVEISNWAAANGMLWLNGWLWKQMRFGEPREIMLCIRYHGDIAFFAGEDLPATAD